MPVTPGQHNRFSVERGCVLLDLRAGGGEHLARLKLALLVERFQMRGEKFGATPVLCGEEFNHGARVVQPTGSIEARPDLESDLGGADLRLVQAYGGEQREQPRALRTRSLAMPRCKW